MSKPVAVVTDVFTSAVPGKEIRVHGKFNVEINNGGVMTIQIERSFDDGVSFFEVSLDSTGTPASYTADFSGILEEPEDGMLYRLNCTAFTSGSATGRISQ